MQVMSNALFNPKAARNSRFQKGSGMYRCRVCERNTRDVGGDGQQVQLCELCFELAGEENHLSDEGKLYDAQSAASTLHRLGTLIGHDKAHELHPEVAAACIANIVKMPVADQPEAIRALDLVPSSGERAYIVFDDDNMAAVCARSNGDAKRQGRKLGMVTPSARHF